MDAGFAEAGDEVLLGQRQEFVASTAGVLDVEPRGRHRGVGKIGLDHRLGGEVEKLPQGFGQLIEPLAERLQPSEQRLGLFVPAVHA